MNRKLLLRIVLIFAGITLPGLVLEFFLRHRVSSHWHLMIPPPDESRPYDLRPNGYASYKGVAMTTDRLGMRSNARYPEIPSIGNRVLFLGDSYFFGLGASDAATIPNSFQEEARAAGRDVVSLNAGVIGYNAGDELSSLKRWAYLKPDTVIWGLFENDQGYSWIAFKPGAEDSVDALAGRSYLFRYLREKFWLALGSDPAPDGADRSKMEISDSALLDIFREAKRWEVSNGAEVIVVPIPGPFDLDEPEIKACYVKFARLAEEAGLRTLDIFPRIKGQRGDAWHAEDNVHYNDAGCRAVGRAIFEATEAVEPPKISSNPPEKSHNITP